MFIQLLFLSSRDFEHSKKHIECNGKSCCGAATSTGNSEPKQLLLLRLKFLF